MQILWTAFHGSDLRRSDRSGILRVARDPDEASLRQLFLAALWKVKRRAVLIDMQNTQPNHPVSSLPHRL